jgi:hypothetical protein
MGDICNFKQATGDNRAAVKIEIPLAERENLRTTAKPLQSFRHEIWAENHSMNDIINNQILQMPILLYIANAYRQKEP